MGHGETVPINANLNEMVLNMRIKNTSNCNTQFINGLNTEQSIVGNMNRRSTLIVVAMLLLMIPLSTISGQANNDETECNIIIDWSNGTSSEHAYVINNWDLVNDSQTEVHWSHENQSGQILENGTIYPSWNENNTQARIILPTNIDLGDSISIDVKASETEIFCSRTIDITYWNQPINDHEITRTTTWMLEQTGGDGQEYELEFTGRGWQLRNGNQLESNELGAGNLSIISDDGETRIETEINLDRVWLNESMTGIELEQQQFEMFGNGSMFFIVQDEVGTETVAEINISDSYITRTIANGVPSEQVRLEGTGNLLSNGTNDDESIDLNGEVSVFLYELHTENGEVLLSNYLLEAYAEMVLIDGNNRFTLDLDEFIIHETWENGEQVDQLNRIKGDGTFDFAESEDGATIIVNGTVPVFWLESQDGMTTVNTILMDGDISGDVTGEIGLVVEIVEAGQQQNHTGQSFDVNVIKNENWLNISQITGIGSNFDLEAEHNLTFEYQVPEEHWLNRTVRYKYVEDSGEINDEYPERSPIVVDPSEPSNESILGSVNISRELGFAPSSMQIGDSLMLDHGDTLKLEIIATDSGSITRDGHEMDVIHWNGTYTNGGIARGKIINEGILAGLIAEVSRSIELEIDDLDGELQFIEIQSLERVISPSIVTEAENTPPSFVELRIREGVLTTEGGEAHLEVVVEDVDWNMQSVEVDLTSIGYGIVSFNDVGIDGDSTVHDDVWTSQVSHLGINHGNEEINITISDGWSTTQVTTSLILTNLAPRMTSLNLDPNTVSRGDSVEITTNVVDAHGVSSVFVDLTGSGGQRFALSQEMGEQWFGSFIVPDGFSPGPQLIAIEMTDNEGAMRLTSLIWQPDGTTIESDRITILNDGPVLSNLTISRQGNLVDDFLVPNLGEEDIPHVISIEVYDPDGISVVQVQLGILAEIGNSDDWVPMNDDGTGGDLVADDGIYSLTIQTRSTMPTGSTEIELRGIDNYLESTPGNERGFTVTLSDKFSEGIGSEWADSTALILIAVGIFSILSILGGIIVLKNANFDEE